MKKFISKIKKSCHKFMTGKSGFSLVELIVVIAIMAVMAAVLAPALLGYVEKSRMQKDASAMDEVVNSIQLSLADQSIYDEVLEHSVWDNVSCYIDKKDESQFTNCKVQLKAEHGDKKEQYMFGDEARLLDETVYYAAGNMRGLTITFSPSESGDTYNIKNGVLNKFVGRNTGYLHENPELYNKVRSTIGDTLNTTSQTYRNSDYTIFIRVGSTGGGEAIQQDAIQVWGQFNGTNLVEKDHKYELSSGRVVGSAGANDAATNEQQQDKDDSVIFGENYVEPPLSTLTQKKWKGFTNINGEYVWTDGSNIYYSRGYSNPHYILNGDTWEVKQWDGLTSFSGDNIWTDGTDIYYSSGSSHYVLDGNRWKMKYWNGLTSFNGQNVWTDGTNIYYSLSTTQRVLNKETSTWEKKVWSGLTNFSGSDIWTDGVNIYRSRNYSSHIFNGSGWRSITLPGLSWILPADIWTDGKNVYYSDNSDQYVFNGNSWETKVWEGLTDFNGQSIWTDGTNYYYSSGTEQYVFS